LAAPGCVILDEDPSAVDPATEVALRNAIQRLTEGRTALTIAHRLATAEHADLILVLERGRLGQHGTQFQLVAHPAVAHPPPAGHGRARRPDPGPGARPAGPAGHPFPAAGRSRRSLRPAAWQLAGQPVIGRGGGAGACDPTSSRCSRAP